MRRGLAEERATDQATKDFAKRYHDEQVTAHKSAVSLYQRYAKGGDNAALKDFAGKTQPNLEEHLTMAQDLDKLDPHRLTATP